MFIILLKIASVFLLIFMGALVRRLKIIDEHSTKQMSQLLISALYPALIFAAIVKQFTIADLLAHAALPAGAFLIVCIGFGLGSLTMRRLHFQGIGTQRTYLLQCTMNNYSFLPMLLAFMFWGDRGVALVIFSTLGSEVGVWTLGVYGLTGRKLSKSTLRNLLNMPLISVAAAVCALAVIHFLPEPSAAGASVSVVWRTLLDTLEMLGKATIPLSMLIAGSRMEALQAEHLFSRPQTILALMRLVLIPATTLAVLLLLPFAEEIESTLVLVAVMPCAITSVMLATVYDRDAEFAASSVLVTHVVSLLTVPVWLRILGVG